MSSRKAKLQKSRKIKAYDGKITLNSYYENFLKEGWIWVYDLVDDDGTIGIIDEPTDEALERAMKNE